MSKVDAWRTRIELEHGRAFEAIVKEQVEAGRTQEEIADFLNLPYWSFRYLLRQAGARFIRSIQFDCNEEMALTP